MDFSYLLNTCIQCARCFSGCPVGVRSLLNIRKLMYLAQIADKFKILDAEKYGLWECTTCQTCTLRCPKNCQPLNLVLDSRARLIEKGKIEPTIIRALESTYLYGNPWGRAREKRIEWINDVSGVRILESGAEVSVILFICCTAHYDPRILLILKALIALFQALEIDFGILGEKESCCGSEIKRLGEVGLFSELKESNIKLIEEIKAKKIITLSPHCFDVLKNEYQELKIPVFHYTQFLSSHFESQGIRRLKPIDKKIVYSDPCFLGKQNKIFLEPRNLIHLFSKELLEFERSFENSLCCGGGGGKMWVESKIEERLAEIRVKDASLLGAEIIATSCPFCVLTLEDAVKTQNKEEEIEVKDILELLATTL